MGDSSITERQGTAAPFAWLLTGHRVGDNNQVLALAELLGWPFEVKRLSYRPGKLLSKLISRQLFGITLAGINRRLSSVLEPPWPDVIISAGRDNEPVARWIRKKSGGRARIVHLGRPWAPPRLFDLILSTPQYTLPERANIFMHDLPLHRVTLVRLAAAGREWGPRLAHLPRPYTVVLVGGNSGEFVLTRCKAERMGRLVNQLASASGGSVLVTDSARTPPEAFERLRAELKVPAYIHRWGTSTEDNPYFGYLALADQIVVTGESTSMLTEASVTGKPMYIFDIGDTPAACDKPGRIGPRYRTIRNRVARMLGPRRLQRDIGNIQRRLVESGRAFWLDDAIPRADAPVAGFSVPPDDAQRIVERVHGLFERE